MRLLASALPVLVMLCTCWGAKGQVLPREELDRFIQPLIDDEWCIGVSVALISDKGTQIVGYGRVVPNDPRVPTGDTLYEIGSVTKGFTGLLLADAVVRKEVTLDTPVQSLLPKDVKVPQRNGKPITLSHLAAQTSGLPRLPGNLRLKDPANPYADYTPQQMYAFLSKHELRREPGTSYEYSNLGMGLLGHALALRAGKSYEALLVERICKPLKMKSTRIALDDDLKRVLAPPHDADGKRVSNWDIPTLAGAGASRSCANDLAKFVSAQCGLTASPLNEAIELSLQKRAEAGKGNDIGLGWHMTKGEPLVWHNGQTGGYHSFVAFSRKHRVGVVLLTNTATGEIDGTGMALLRRLIGEEVTPRKLPKIERVASNILDRYTGTYVLGFGVIVTVERHGNQPHIQLTGQPSYRVYPRSQDEFFWKVVDARIEFEVEDDGKPAKKLILRQNGTEQTAWRVKIPATQPATIQPARSQPSN